MSISNYNTQLQSNNVDLQAILDAVNNLPEASTGVELPELTNPATANDLVEGKELIDADGNVIVGEVMELTSENTSSQYGMVLSTIDDTEVKTMLSNVLMVAPLNQYSNVLIREGAFVSMIKPKSAFGDATAEDVAEGKTFTSAAGLNVVGTASSSSDLTVVTGTFTPAEDTQIIAVSHNLGKIPKIIFVFLENNSYHVATLKSSSMGTDAYRPSLAAYVYGHSVAVYGASWSSTINTYTKYYTGIDITSTAANLAFISGVTDVSLTVDISKLQSGPATSPSSLRGGSTYRYIVAG